MECFPNAYGLSYVSVLERAQRKHFEQRGSVKKKMNSESVWMKLLLHSKWKQSDLQEGVPGSSRLAFGASGNTWRVSLFCGEPLCAVVFK